MPALRESNRLAAARHGLVALVIDPLHLKRFWYGRSTQRYSATGSGSEEVGGRGQEGPEDQDFPSSVEACASASAPTFAEMTNITCLCM